MSGDLPSNKKILKSLLKDKLKRNFRKNLFEDCCIYILNRRNRVIKKENGVHSRSVVLLILEKILYHHNRFILTNSKQPSANLLKKLIDLSNNSHCIITFGFVSATRMEIAVFTGSKLITS